MTYLSDQAELVVDGQLLSTWLDYSVDSKLLTPADGFRFRVAVPDPAQREQVRGLLAPGKRVQLYIGSPDVATGESIRQRGALQLTGVIDERRTTANRNEGVVFQIEGRDLAGFLVKASVPIDLLRNAGTRLIDLAHAAIAPWSGEPWNMRVVADDTAGRDILTGGTPSDASSRRSRQARAHGVASDRFSRRARLAAEANRAPISEYALADVDVRTRAGSASGMVQDDIARLTVRDARPHAGESVWQFLDRHARRLGVLMWMSPRGELVLGSIRYDQPPIYRLVRRLANDPADPNTILSGGLVENVADRASSVTVYGRASGGDLARATVRATADDPEMAALGIYAPVTVHDNSIRTQAEADRRAQRELAKGKANAFVLQYTVAHHGQRNYLFATLRIATVLDESADVEGEFLIVDRTFTKSRRDGTRTTLTLVPKGSIVLSTD